MYMTFKIFALFYLFGLMLNFPVNSYGHVGMVSSPDHTFGASLTKLLTSTLFTSFACKCQQPFLNQRKGGERL